MTHFALSFKLVSAPLTLSAILETFRLTLEDGSGHLLLEDGSYLLLENAP